MKYLSFLFLTCWCAAAAKSPFNTIEQRPTLYSVETFNSVTLVDSAMVAEETVDDGKDEEHSQIDSMEIKRKEAVDAYLSVCLPLKKISVSSRFGTRRNPFNHSKTEVHKGCDLKAVDAEVYAMMCGVVEKVSSDKRSGNYVTIRHGDYTVSYCHLSKATCKKGDFVTAGDVVGISGNTGRSTGPHLHLTVRYKGHHIDPEIVLGYIDSVKARALAELISLGGLPVASE